MKIKVLSLSILAFLLPFTAVSAPQFGLFMVVKGDIKIESQGRPAAPVKVGSKIHPGDTVISGPDSRAKIVMADRNVINISPDTKMALEIYDSDQKSGTKNVQMNLLEGKVRNNVEQKYDGEKSKFLIKTPTAVAGVRGTQFLTSFDPRTRLTQIVTMKGAVALSPINAPPGSQPVIVKKGEASSFTAGAAAPEPPRALPKEEMKKIDKESSSQAPSKSDDASAGNKERGGDAKAKEGDEKGGEKTADQKPDQKADQKAEQKSDQKPDQKTDQAGDQKSESKGDKKPEQKSDSAADKKSDKAPGSRDVANDAGAGDVKPKEAPPAKKPGPSMIDSRDLDTSVAKEIRNPRPATAPPPPPPIPVVRPVAPPPATSPAVSEIVKTITAPPKAKVIIKPVPK